MKNEGLVFILLLVIILRLPSLFEPLWYGDEGIYLTLGQALRKGLVWYRDIHDNKPPLLYLIAAISANLFYFRLILMVWFLVTVAAFYRLLQLLLPKNRLTWYLGVFALIGLTILTEGNIANAEIFMILPLIWAMFLTARQQRFGLIGLLFSAAFLFKVPAGTDLAAAGLWLIIFPKTKLKNLIKLGLGFFIPVLITIIYYSLMGAFTPYVRSALMQNIGYLSTWGDSQGGLKIRAVILIVALSLFIALAKKLKTNRYFNLTVIWFLFALFGALLSGRPYPHYLIQPAVPGAILISWLISTKKKAVRIIVLSVAVLTIIAYQQIGFWGYPVLQYYRNFGAYLFRRQSLTAYRNSFDPQVEQNYAVADYIKQKTMADDKIFVWGDEPAIYALSRHLPVGRYTVTYHILDFNGFSQTIAAWDKQPPKIVVLMDGETSDWPQMASRLASDYVLAKTVGSARIYRKLEIR